MQESTIYINAEPLAREGEWAIWRFNDIPDGIVRGPCFTTEGYNQDELKALFAYAFSADRSCQIIHVRSAKWPYHVAVVSRANLESRSARGGRESMTSKQWGLFRDDQGICKVCGASSFIWCDQVVHRAATTQTDILWRCTSCEHISLEPNSVPAIIGKTTSTRLCERCRSRTHQVVTGIIDDVKTRAERAEAESRSVNQLIYDREMDPVRAHMMSAAFYEYAAWGDDGPPKYMRAAWSRELRRRINESNERERNRVLVDREYEDWE